MRVAHCVNCGDDALQCLCPDGPVVVWSPPRPVFHRPVAQKPVSYTVRCRECGSELSAAQDGICRLCDIK